MNQYVQQDFSEIVDQLIARYCRLGAGLNISDRMLFPAFRAFWIVTEPETLPPALLGQFRVAMAERGFRSHGSKRPRWYGLALHRLTVLSEQEENDSLILDLSGRVPVMRP
jgi:hypothetical protein